MELELKYDNWVPDTIDNNLASGQHSIDSNIAIIWNSDTERYDAISTKSASSITPKPIITELVTALTEIQCFSNKVRFLRFY